MRKLLLALIPIFSFLTSEAQKYNLTSPDQKIIVTIEVADQISVQVTKKDHPVISFSGLAMETMGDKNPFSDLRIKKINRKSVDETVQPAIRDKCDAYKNHFNELELIFKSNYSITFRLFNEGVAYRYSSRLKDSLTILKESLAIQCQEEDSMRFQPSKAFRSSYETPYELKKINAVAADQLVHLPVLIEKQEGPFVMFTEADLYHYPGSWINGTGKSALTLTHPTYPKSYSYTGNSYVRGQIAEREQFIAKVAGTRTFPWRIFAVADREDGLINNNMVYLLASPTEMKDLSWIKPGVVMFDWWAKNNIYGVNFKAGINTETAKYFIDFCAAKGFRYFLFDDGWCPKEDILHEIPGLNMAEVTAYAQSKGVDIMLWVIWNSLKQQWDQAFEQYEKWGIKGIKMDFMDRDDQPMVEFYEAVARKAAEKKMVLDFHGAYKPEGLSRKYPNLLTREALIEFEYSGGTTWDNTTHHNLLPYIRMFTGPMDYIPGTMRNSTKDNFRAVGDYPMGQGTRAHSMALFVILSSPMEMLPDSPSDYYREKECTDFLAKIPVEWNETKLLKGRIGHYTILARRSGTNWFIGAITDNAARKFDLPTDFLPPGKYHLELIEDGINANTRAEDYKRREANFAAGEILKLNLARGGGWVAHITPLK